MTYFEVPEGYYEGVLKRLQAELWAIERPGDLINVRRAV